MTESELNKNGNFTNWGPYLSYNQDSSNSMVISWESDQYMHHRKLSYGETEECKLTIEEKWCEPSKHHSIKIENLKPNTKYYYKIERWKVYGDQAKIYSFKTGPEITENNAADEEKNNFEFTLTGDIHAFRGSVISPGFQAMDRTASDRNFYVTVGDSIMDGNSEQDWQEFFKQVGSFLHERPIMNTTGNHDTDNEGKYSRFITTWDHPYYDKKLGGFYSFRYANAKFIMVDSNNAGGWEPTPCDEQYDWLEEELEDAYNKNLWIIVAMHHQIYSTGDFSMAKVMHEALRPMFDEYHVDMVFYGHDHHYEAFWNKSPEWGGTKYFVAGGGGGQQRIDHSIMGSRNGGTKYIWPKRIYSYSIDGIPPMSENPTQKTLAYRNDEFVPNQLIGVLEPNFVDVKIKGNSCNLRCMGWQDQVFHEINFNKNPKK